MEIEEFYKKIRYYDFSNNIIKSGWQFSDFYNINKYNEICIKNSKNKNLIIFRKEFKYILNKVNINNTSYRTISNDLILKRLCLIKIKSCEDSIKEFGNASIKYNMMSNILDNKNPEYPKYIEQLFTINKIYLNHKCIKTGNILDVISIKLNKGPSYKFVLSDLEFIYPDIEKLTKGYNESKDRKVYIGSFIRIKNPHNISRIPLKTKGVVEKLVTAGHNKYCDIRLEDDKIYRVELNKLKVINNDKAKKTYKEESSRKISKIYNITEDESNWQNITWNTIRAQTITTSF